MTWLVTGGADYIGAHVVRALQAAGVAPVVVDDIPSGHASFVPKGVPFVEGTILHRALLADTMREHGVTGVIHVAGFKYAGVSVQRPLHLRAERRGHPRRAGGHGGCRCAQHRLLLLGRGLRHP